MAVLKYKKRVFFAMRLLFGEISGIYYYLGLALRCVGHPLCRGGSVLPCCAGFPVGRFRACRCGYTMARGLLLRGVGVSRLLFLPDFSADEDVEGGPDDDVHYKQQRGPYVGR